MTDTPNPESGATFEPPTFEAALAQLQEIVMELEEGKSGLEQSLARFEQGIGLLRNCYQILERAEQKIELLVNADAAGNFVTVAFDATATAEMAGKPQKKTGRRRAAPTEAKPPDTPETSTDGSAEGEHTLF